MAAIAAAIAGCSCTEHHRIDLPTGTAYNDALNLVQSKGGTLRIVVPATTNPAQSSEAGILRRFGAHAGTISLGHQTIEKLTFAGSDDGVCSPFDSAVDEYGYDARVDRLTPLGRALVDAHVLVVGYKNDLRTWDGKAHIAGVFATLQAAAPEDEPHDYGEPIRLASEAKMYARILLDF